MSVCRMLSPIPAVNRVPDGTSERASRCSNVILASYPKAAGRPKVRSVAKRYDCWKRRGLIGPPVDSRYCTIVWRPSVEGRHWRKVGCISPIVWTRVSFALFTATMDCQISLGLPMRIGMPTMRSETWCNILRLLPRLRVMSQTGLSRSSWMEKMPGNIIHATAGFFLPHFTKNWRRIRNST